MAQIANSSRDGPRRQIEDMSSRQKLAQELADYGNSGFVDRILLVAKDFLSYFGEYVSRADLAEEVAVIRQKKSSLWVADVLRQKLRQELKSAG